MYKILANTLFPGKKVIYMPTCHSTNEVALKMTGNSAPLEGTVVITDYQTAGKGQRGNCWQSARGENLTLSVILKPTFITPSCQFFLNMAVSLAVRATVLDFVPQAKCTVKWPNDVFIGRRKVAGILIENTVRKNHIEWSVAGVGLNVNQKDFGVLNATSLGKETQQIIQLSDAFARFIYHLESFYLQLKAGKTTAIRQQYIQYLLGYNTPMRWRSEYEFKGEIIDIDNSGLLSIMVNGQVKRFDFKEVELII